MQLPSNLIVYWVEMLVSSPQRLGAGSMKSQEHCHFRMMTAVSNDALETEIFCQRYSGMNNSVHYQIFYSEIWWLFHRYIQEDLREMLI